MNVNDFEILLINVMFYGQKLVILWLKKLNETNCIRGGA